MNSKKKLLSETELFYPTKRTMVDWNRLFEHLFVDGSISKAHVKRILNTASKFFGSEPNLLYLEDPVTIVGDIHGQFYDVKEIFRLGGNPDETKYLFLGDYVDRGIYGVEVIITLMALKVNCPNTVFMLRGNHECRQMTQFHNFREEVLRKYDQEIYLIIMDIFDKLPIACVINGRFLTVHGGISPQINNCVDINKINRFIEPPITGGLCDLLWSDPVDNPSGMQPNIWQQNKVRGCSYYYGYLAISKFLKKNGLMSIIRAHEAQYEGFKTYLWQDSTFPQVITLFSAPNYCGTYANKGAIIKIDNNDLKVIQYNFTPKPDILIQLGDAFTWSLPILSNSLMDMFVGFLSYTNDMVLNRRNSGDISMLDDTVLDALDITSREREEVLNDNSLNLTFLEQFVEEQKMKKRISNKKLMRRLSHGRDLEILEDFSKVDEGNVLKESFPEHFHYMKHEDSINEARPEK